MRDTKRAERRNWSEDAHNSAKKQQKTHTRTQRVWKNDLSECLMRADFDCYINICCAIHYVHTFRKIQKNQFFELLV